MSLGTPRWWYQRRSGPMGATRLLLTPVSWLWAGVTAWKIAAAKPVDPGAPVICVGNLTMGGAGKTPIVQALMAHITSLGVPVHGLSRGYGGRLPGPVQVDPERHTAQDVGDEPLLLALEGPVWVARNRAEGAAEAVISGASVIVMDDGHQNGSVAKALSLVVVDGETRDGEWPFGGGGVFPAGPMREPLKAGLARADAVILLMPGDLGRPDPELLKLFGSTPVLVARLEPAQSPPRGPQLGFAGVGKPWKVERSLRAAGCQLVDFAAFPDHFAYDEATLQALHARATDAGAGLVTTEKDWVRLPPHWRGRVVAWPVRARFVNPAALTALLEPVLPA